MRENTYLCISDAITLKYPSVLLFFWNVQDFIFLYGRIIFRCASLLCCKVHSCSLWAPRAHLSYCEWCSGQHKGVSSYVGFIFLGWVLRQEIAGSNRSIFSFWSLSIMLFLMVVLIFTTLINDNSFTLHIPPAFISLVLITAILLSVTTLLQILVTLPSWLIELHWTL